MSRGSPFHAATADQPALIRDQTVASHVRYEHAADGAPLVITFGFYASPRPAEFTFEGRMKKLQAVSGRPLNTLHVRDPSLQWYLGGIDGVGVGVAATADAFAELIAFLQPSSVITIGQSMGAYAAMLFGTLLEAQKVVAFGPVSAFDRRIWSVIGDTRWLPVLAEMEASGLDTAPYHDLPPLIEAARGHRPDIDLIFSGFAGPGAAPHDAVAIDAAHAARFVNTPGVTLLPVVHSLHAVVEYFRAAGVITEVLAQRIFGTSLAPIIGALRKDAFIAWALDNRMRGASFADLRTELLKTTTPEHADDLLARTKLVIDLTRLEDTPPAAIA
jgi:pimeloyl-ACP methyl ester carboxylesterase